MALESDRSAVGYLKQGGVTDQALPASSLTGLSREVTTLKQFRGRGQPDDVQKVWELDNERWTHHNQTI